MDPYYNWNFFTPIDLLPWSDLLRPLCKRTSPLQCFQTGVGQYSVCLFNGSINLCWLTPWIVWLIPSRSPPVTGGKPEGFGQFHRYRGKIPINGGPGSPDGLVWFGMAWFGLMSSRKPQVSINDQSWEIWISFFWDRGTDGGTDRVTYISAGRG